MERNVLKNITVLHIAIFIVVVVTGIFTAQNIWLESSGQTTTMGSFYHNYLIFKHSFFHLLNNTNLYQSYPGELSDLFKYSPTFALFFGLFAHLPDWLGLFLWNLLNGLVFVGLWNLPFPQVKNKLWVVAAVLVEYITNIQNAQSNGLMAGLMILTLVFLQRKNIALATLMVVLSAYVKIFGVLAFVFFLFYPQKGKAIAYSLLWSVLLFVLPLLVISPSQLVIQYQNWGEMLVHDKPVAYSPSFVGWLKSWFSITINNGVVLVLGMLVFLAPLIQFKKYGQQIFQYLMLASALIWVVIFNHKAESPTFIIAVAGVAIWYFSQPKSGVRLTLLIGSIVFTQLSPSDLFPVAIREHIFYPYVIKVVPVIGLWFVIIYSLFVSSAPRDEGIE